MMPSAITIALESPAGLRPWLQVFQFWILEALFLAVIATTAWALPALVRSLRAGRSWWLAAGALTIAAAIIVSALPPTTNRIYYDEQIYQDAGRNMAELRLSQTCHYGIVEYGSLECVGAEYNKEPYGYPYLLSVGYRLFGVHEWVAHAVNRASHATLVLLLCITAARWFGDRMAGLFAGLAATFLPEQLRWASTAAAEPVAATACLLAVLAAVEFARSRTTPALAWLVCTAAFAANMRPEAVLIVPVCGLVVLAHAPDELGKPRVWYATLAAALLLSSVVAHTVAVSGEGWGAPQKPFAFAHFSENLPVNLWFYLWDSRFPVWLTPLAAAGFVWGLGQTRARWTAAAYAIAFWGIFLFFYAGSYDFGADVRYSLMSYPPIMLLAGLGLSRLIDRIVARAGHPRLVATGVAAGLTWLFLWQAPYVRAIGEEAWSARADVTFARELVADLPPDSLVLTHDPNMFLLWGRNAAQAALAVNDPDFLRRAGVRHGGKIYFHFGFWCNVADEAQQRLCTTILSKTPHRLIRERTERINRYALYELEAPK